MYIIGVDPDAERHGVAVFHNGELVSLHMMQSIELADMARRSSAIVSIENVMANKFVYGRNTQSSKAAQSKISMQIGRCQQSQIELQRMLDHLSVPYQLVKPGGNWAKDKARFEAATGWTKKSNEDTRSAAYFGWLLVNNGRYGG